MDISNRVQKFVDCRSRDVSKPRDLHRGGRLRPGRLQALARRGVPGHNARARQDPQLPEGRLRAHFQKRDNNGPHQGPGLRRGGADKHIKELPAFELESLRWSKVIICTDADVDGFQIRTLILTMLYRLAPTLIREGYVYIAESPLYEIESGGKTWFAYSEREKAEILEGIGRAKVTINRSKGLGENDPDMMWLTTMNPETRRLIRVMPEEAERTGEIFDLLLGDNLAGRKQHISEFGSQYLDLADIS